MPVLLLSVAILCEVAGTIALRESNGFTRPAPVLVMAIGYGVSLFLLSVALKHIPISVAYAVWAGAGTALTAVAGVLVYGESLSSLKVLSLLLIVVGVAFLAGSHAP